MALELIVPLNRQSFPTTSVKGARRIVTLCGSTAKALKEFRQANLLLTLSNFLVFTIGCDTHSDTELARMGELGSSKEDLDQLHIDKVKLSHIVYALNPTWNEKDYVGFSMGREIAVARALEKEIWWLQSHVCSKTCNCQQNISQLLDVNPVLVPLPE